MLSSYSSKIDVEHAVNNKIRYVGNLGQIDIYCLHVFFLSELLVGILRRDLLTTHYNEIN